MLARRSRRKVEGGAMRLFMFKADAHGLNAFAGNAEGSELPARFAPWATDGVVEEGRQLPHGMSRHTIESAVKLEGFQLWRVKKKKKEAEAEDA
ncbi:MAG: hypothetical protein SFV21_21435 [Rhodospirillaceae bacterium]|nr:hypothetical protein [Rhodospirillaceae bacterium]